jgi:hypothetical protein
MAQKEIIEGNKLIAEFMGFEFGGVAFLTPHKKILANGDESSLYFPEDLKFHSSWDWLIPVVEKIEKEGFIFYIKENESSIENHWDNALIKSFGDYVAPTKIQACYMAVINFIKWYNGQT